ncbi:uncharacterized protein LOC143905654 isoform X2 [Temnothorax americanus]|uniref:uncharacterized protein LOC143905654 isoform X2 n=1 Tax=Temnothorax americanus TaxID=1964332 RepID=UPI0040679E68
MYAIVRFYDNVHYVCSINQVYATHHITKARYRDGFRYPATIIAKNKDKKLLQTIVTNIDTKKPYVSCNRTYKELSSDKSSTQILDCNNRRSVIVPTFCGTTKHKIFNDTSANKDDTITLHKPDIDCHNIHVKTFHRNKESMNCDKMSANNDECNNETDILNQKDSCRRNVDKSLSYGDINKTINCNDEYTNNENDENDANYSNADCQRNILMPMSCISTNNIRDSNDKNTTTNETKNCSLKFNSLNSVDLLRDAHDETITTIHSNEESGGNDKTGISIQDFFTEECDMMLPVIDINSNLYGVNMINQRDIDTESENIEVSISSPYNGCAFNNVDKCVKRLTFSTTEEPSVDAGNVCALPTCQDNTNPEIVDVSISNDNDNDEDADYTPSEHSSLDSESPQNHAPIVNQTTTSISSFDTSNTNVVGTSACNDEVMYVENSNTKSRKRYYCTFCMKPQAQLPRHLETVHRDEPEVKKFAVLSKKDPERKKIIDGIRKAGTFKFNTNPEFNTGQLIVCRRPNKKANKAATDFIACVKCKDFFAKSSIRHHSRVCIKKDFRKNKTIMIMGRQITGRIHPLANETLRKTVFPVMRDDLVTRIIRYDKLLILYGNKLCVKYKAQHQHDMIRARLRLLGRFLLVLKEINKKIEDFQSIYYPQIYDDCILRLTKLQDMIMRNNFMQLLQ